MKAGFIGLGNMGAGMATNLARHGELLVFDMDRRRAERIAGATGVDSMEDVAEGGDVLLSLPGPPEVAAVAEQLLPAMAPGSLLINLSTVAPSDVIALRDTARERGIDVVDAPVTGAPDGALNGTLTVMVGAEPDVLERARPLIDTFAANLVHTGPVGTGTAAKLIVNMLWFTHVVALSDALSLGVKAGLTPDILGDLLPVSAGASWVTAHDLPNILQGDRGQGEVLFTLRLCNKDLDLIDRFGSDSDVEIPLGRLARARFAEAAERYGIDAGEFAVVRVAEEAAGVVLERSAAERSIAGDWS
jgi:3-hydroxyisobutyrate dehydrogenase